MTLSLDAPGSADGGVFWIGADGRILEASEAACATLGCDRDQVRTLTAWDIDRSFPADHWPAFWQRVQESRQLRFKSRHWTRDGTPYDVEVVAHLADFATPPHLVATATPLSGQRQVEQVLRDSEARLALALEVSGQSLFEFDLTTGAALLTDAFLAMIGRQGNPLVTDRDTWQSWIHPDDRPWVAEVFKECATGQRSDYREDVRLLHGDGHVIWVRACGRVTQWDEFNRPVRMLSTQMDITESKKAEHALKLTQAAIDRVFVGVFWHDAQGRLLYVNEAACRSLGYTRDELIGQTVALFDPVFPQEQIPRTGEFLRDKKMIVLETLHQRKDGTRFPVEVEASYVKMGETENVFAFVRDITGRKAADSKLRYHLECEQALADISGLMIKPGWDDLDSRLEWMLQRIGGLTGADRAFLFSLSPDGETATNTHEWCAPGISSQIHELQAIPVADHAAFYDRMRRGDVVTILGEPETWTPRFKPRVTEPGPHSLICLPVASGPRLYGMLGLDVLSHDRDWSEVDIRVLRLVAEILAHTWQHYESYRVLSDHSHYLEHLDRISRVLTGSERDASMLTRLATAILDIFQADRVIIVKPRAGLEVATEVTRPDCPPLAPRLAGMAAEDPLLASFQAAIAADGPVTQTFAAGATGAGASAPRSQLAIALRPHADRPWLLALHHGGALRLWTDTERRLMQSIAERVEEALAGALLLQRLTDSETRYRAVFDNAQDAILLHDIDGRIIAANPAMHDMFGLTEAEAMTHTIPDISAPGFDPEGLTGLWRQARRGEAPRFEWKAMQPKTGHVFPVEVMLRSFRYGDRFAILANIRDMTERARAEEELRKSEERFAKAFRANPAAMLISTLDQGRIIDANDRWLDIFGGELSDWIGRTTVDTGVWQGVEERAPHVERIRQQGSFRDVPTVLHTQSGKALDVLWSVEMISQGSDRVMLSLIHDLTEQKRAEQARRDSEARLRTAIESIPFDFFVMTAEGEYVVQNSSSMARWGDVIGLGPAEATAHRGQADRWAEKLATVHAGAILDEEIQVTMGTDILHFRNLLAPVTEGTQTRGIVEVNIDITARKQAERELQTYRAHLEDLVSERTQALQNAMNHLMQAEKLAALGNLVAGLAHELNTPLGNARMVASTLAEHVRTLERAVSSGALRRAELLHFLEESTEATRLLERNTIRAANLISHVKEVAVDQTSVRRRSFRLRQVIEEVLSTLRPTLKRTDHVVSVEVPADLSLDSFPGPLEQVITNLVSNSLTHGFAHTPAGHIRITARAEDANTILLTYDDDGVGIPADVVQRIFDPFFTTRLGTGGSGLGLYIVYTLVSGVLGGSIAVTSDREAGGATFTLRLPRVAPERGGTVPTPHSGPDHPATASN